MGYFVTGATGFIGRNLVELLLKREGTIYVLVREGSKGRLEELRSRWGVDEDRVVGIVGDLSQARLGVSDEDVAKLTGDVDHLFHLAAIYDMKADAESQQVANIDGTRHMVELAEAIDAGCVHMVSSIAAAGLYPGIWREDMFEEAVNLDTDPYFRTKHDSEGIVRNECSRPWRVYRPGIVVGDSETGEMDKVDGPYYFFKLIRRIRNAVPKWLPMAGVEGRQINIVPVDFVVKALDHIAHEPDLDGRAFHLTDPNAMTAGEVIDTFAQAAHAPQTTVRLPAGRHRGIPTSAELPCQLRTARQHGHGRRARRFRHSSLGPDVHELADPVRLEADAGRPGGFRYLGSAARRLRGQALGLLGAPPGPRPLPRQDPRRGRQGPPWRDRRRSARSSSIRFQTRRCASPGAFAATSRSTSPCAGGSSWSPALHRASASRRR